MVAFGWPVFAFTFFSVAVSASSTIEFSGLSQPENGIISVGGSITEQGFIINSATSNFNVWGASSPNLPGLSPVNTSLFEYYAGSTTTLTNAGNATFTLSSIDLAPVLPNGSGTFTVNFTGTLADSSTVSQGFTVSNSPNLQTFNFSNFDNVISVSFTQGTNSGLFGQQISAYQFNNLVVIPTAVPVPAAFWMFGLALGALGYSGNSARRMTCKAVSL